MRTALIVGAGIGGLSAGLALRRAGWDVRIFERFPSARELGLRGEMLAGNVDVPRTLRAFGAERQPKTAALVRQGRRTARFMRIRNPFACAARELAFRMFPARPLIKLYVRVNRRAGTDTSAPRSSGLQ